MKKGRPAEVLRGPPVAWIRLRLSSAYAPVTARGAGPVIGVGVIGVSRMAMAHGHGWKVAGAAWAVKGQAEGVAASRTQLPPPAGRTSLAPASDRTNTGDIMILHPAAWAVLIVGAVVIVWFTMRDDGGPPTD